MGEGTACELAQQPQKVIGYFAQNSDLRVKTICPITPDFAKAETCPLGKVMIEKTEARLQGLIPIGPRGIDFLMLC